MDLHGMTALVTGSARRVGRAVALRLAADGADVAIHFRRSADDADATVAAAAALGVRAEAFGADLADPDEIERLVAAVGARFGRLDVLVNSAAVFRRRRLEDVPADEWDRTMAVNLRAPHLCIRAAAPLLRAATRPHGEPAAVVNVADAAGVLAWPGYGAHGAAKAGLLHLTRVAALELAPEIRVNAVVPGPVLAPSWAGDAWERIAAGVPLGRAGTPEDVAEAVAYLVRADYVTGAALAVDGGQTLVAPPRSP